jgi:hypothetical protein
MFTTVVPIEMVGRTVGDDCAVRPTRFIAEPVQLKAAEFQHDDVVGLHLRQIAEQAVADVAAEPCTAACGLQNGRQHSSRR